MMMIALPLASGKMALFETNNAGVNRHYYNYLLFTYA